MKSDTELFAAIQQNDERAFESLFRKYFARLQAFAQKFVPNSAKAKDIVQEVFISLWENRHQTKNIAIRAFLFKLVRNQCLNHIKHLKVVENRHHNFQQTRQWEELYRIDFLRDQPYILIEKQLDQEIKNIVQTLPPKTKQVFVLSRIEGLKNREIAQKLGVTTKAVEKNISKALKIFRTHFANQLPVHIIALAIAGAT